MRRSEVAVRRVSSRPTPHLGFTSTMKGSERNPNLCSLRQLAPASYALRNNDKRPMMGARLRYLAQAAVSPLEGAARGSE
jgi:hypothetical protein